MKSDFLNHDVGRHREVFVVLIMWMNFGDVHVEALCVVLSPMVTWKWKVALSAGDGCYV
jgi:hypothetical protein